MFIIKSIDKKYTESFLNGNIKFKDYREYWTIENNKIGDDSEGRMKFIFDDDKGYDLYINNSQKFYIDGFNIKNTPNFKYPMKIDCYSFIDEKYIVNNHGK